MKLAHIETRAIATEIIDDILCNRCGNSCRITEGEYSASGIKSIHFHFGGLIETEVHGQYNSVIGLFDMTKYKFSICELCLVELFDTFKIPPHIFCNIDHETVTLEQHRADRAAREARRLEDNDLDENVE